MKAKAGISKQHLTLAACSMIRWTWADVSEDARVRRQADRGAYQVMLRPSEISD